MNDTITIYWSLAASVEHLTKVNLMWGPPVPVLSTLPEKAEGLDSYIRCFGMKNFFKNTYTFIHPVDAYIGFNQNQDNLLITEFGGAEAWQNRNQKAYKEQWRLYYDFSWLFFAEESVTMSQFPPILHNTADRSGGAISTGSFDISKWFRQINMDYILWKDATSLTVKKGEPAFYLSFDTNKKIIFKQFEMSHELLEISNQAVAHKQYFPNESLNILYDRFTLSNRHKRVLKLIKENIL